MSVDSKFKESRFVALASIAAELHSVMAVAKGVSLAAKNAKYISAQAGENALGFQPITDFIDEISQQAITGVNNINEAALKLSKIAVYEQRSYNAYQRFNLVYTKHKNANHIKSLSDTMIRVEDKMEMTRKKYKCSLNELVELLESMDECMRSAQSIASVSRIVTSSSNEYQAKLEIVANSLDEAAKFIKEKVSGSYHHLNHIKAHSNG